MQPFDNKFLFQVASQSFERLKALEQVQSRNETDQEFLIKTREIYRDIIEKVPPLVLKANRNIPYFYFFYGTTLYYLTKDSSNRELKENAVRLIKNAIDNSPPQPALEYSKQLIDILMNEKKYSEAISTIQNLFGLAGYDPYYMKIAADLLAKVNRHEEAMQYLKKLVSLDPYDTVSLLGLGKVLLNRKSYDEALRYFQKVREIESTNPECYKLIGKILIIKGQKALAGSNFKLAVGKKLYAHEQYLNSLKMKSTAKPDPRDDERNTLLFLYEMYTDLIKCGENFVNELKECEDKIRQKGYLTPDQILTFKRKNLIAAS